MNTLCRCLLASLMGLIGYDASIKAGLAQPLARVQVAGPPEIVFEWKKAAGGRWLFPDAPARAFVDYSGAVRFFAVDASNWSMVGRSLNALTPSLTSAFAAGKKNDATASDSAGWIEATFTKDGQHVFGLVSNDWAPSPNAANTDPKRAASHYMTINAVESGNGGQSFAYLAGNHVLAADPPQLAEGSGRSIGFATTSNIFQLGKYYYTFLGARDLVEKQSGSCLFRTETLDQLSRWEFWNGSRFIAASSIPRQAGIPSHTIPCKPVAVDWPKPVEFRSVSYWPDCGCYITAFEGAQADATRHVESGFFISESQDLLHWSAPTLLLRRPLDADCKEILVYPSILDPKSPDRNFFSITANPYVYFTRINRTSCRGTMDRDLLRIPVSLAQVSAER